MRETEEGRSMGRVRERSGGYVASLEEARAKRQAGGGGACVGHALVLLARRKTTGEGARWLGRPLGPPGGCAGELAQVSISRFYYSVT